MVWTSMLFPTGAVDEIPNVISRPDFFEDLNLGQVIDAITEQKQEYDLKPFFYLPLHDIEVIRYRQEIFRDLENANTLNAIKTFAEKISLVRRYLNLAQKLYYKRQQAGWFLEAAVAYCQAVSGLVGDLEGASLRSRGFLDFRTYLTTYVASPAFHSLQEEARALKHDLASIKYCVIIRGNWVGVRKCESEIDYSSEVERTFEKFKQGDTKGYRIDLPILSGVSHVEAQILDCVAKLYPDIFKRLEAYCLNHQNFVDPVISTFDREIQFFISYIDFMANLEAKGLNFCYPQLTKTKSIHAKDAFDIALAHKRLSEPGLVVPNDFYLEGKERIIVVSGPNQGGKTTFARMFGQLHFLASLGCPVPGTEATLFLYDQIFTHFEKEESVRNLRGKLQDDLVRIHAILEEATSESILILNEIFTSTALKDAIFLSKEVLKRVISLDAFYVFVTFIDELSTLSEQTVSMVSTVVPENPALRTFKIVRRPADGLAYAICIAEKYHLTYDLIKERIKE